MSVKITAEFQEFAERQTGVGCDGIQGWQARCLYQRLLKAGR